MSERKEVTVYFDNETLIKEHWAKEEKEEDNYLKKKETKKLKINKNKKKIKKKKNNLINKKKQIWNLTKFKNQKRNAHVNKLQIRSIFWNSYESSDGDYIVEKKEPKKSC